LAISAALLGRSRVVLSQDREFVAGALNDALQLADEVGI